MRRGLSAAVAWSQSGAARQFVSGAAANLAGQAGVKLFDVVVLAVAARVLSLDVIGLVLFAEGAAGMLFAMADLGLCPVLVRRTARGQAGPATLRRALSLRAGGIALVGTATAITCLLMVPEHAPLLIAVAVAAGVFRIHEMGRGILVGAERFGLNAALAIGARLVGATLSVSLMLSGFGVAGWLAGRIAAELLHAAFVLVLTRRLASQAPSDSASGMVSEGVSFWGRATLAQASVAVDIILLTAWHGPEVMALYGFAARIFAGALLVLTTALAVAYPRMARARSAQILRRPILLIAAVGLVTGLSVILLGPVALRILLGSWSPLGNEAIRILGLALVVVALAQPMEAGLDASDRERRVLILAGIVQPCSLVLMILVVPTYGILGAAWVAVGREALRLVGLLLVASRYRMERK